MSGYERRKQRAAQQQRQQAQEGRELGDLPPIADPKRRRACAKSFRRHCETYHNATFALKWSKDHLRVIGQIEDAVLGGGLFATAMPRGSGKTSLAEVACEWAMINGYHSFVALIGSDEGAAAEMLESIKVELEINDLLADDYPEVCGPIRALEGIANRCRGQCYQGERTRIEWTAGSIVLPSLKPKGWLEDKAHRDFVRKDGWSLASGAILKVAGLTGGIRGMKHKRADGSSVRPTLVVPDDPQTDASARSPSQCATRERILAGAVLGLAGPGKKISGIMPCTVIAQGDMADSILDRDKHPEWNGTRTKMVYSFPTNEKLWDEYARLRAEGLKSEKGTAEATKFYRKNRREMDAGAVVAWPQRYNHDEISAIQHAMNLKLRDERAFFSEYQNEPIADADSRPDDLTPDQIMAKLNRHPRGTAPASVDRITAFLDVQKSLLYYTVVGWESGFGGNLLAYGTWPDQKRAYFTLRDAKNTIADVVKAPDLEGQIYAALEALTTELLGREWPRDDGVALKIERCLIDANWGESTEIIYKFVRRSQFSAVLTPSHGKYIGASTNPMRDWAKREGERVGLNWRLRNTDGRRSVRSVIFDANYWKSFLANRLAVPAGSRSSFSLYGDRSEAHRLIAEHICSEYRVRVEAKGSGRQVDEWKSRPNWPDNHWWDCLVGSAVAASMQGVALDEATVPAVAKPKRVSFAEMQRNKRQPPQAGA
jgi:hypothetical protein